ncbi:hypothetical protein K438DRAFT_1618473, partial [Mycena galopus ATCC 62051]
PPARTSNNVPPTSNARTPNSKAPPALRFDPTHLAAPALRSLRTEPRRVRGRCGCIYGS